MPLKCYSVWNCVWTINNKKTQTEIELSHENESVLDLVYTSKSIDDPCHGINKAYVVKWTFGCLPSTIHGFLFPTMGI